MGRDVFGLKVLMQFRKKWKTFVLRQGESHSIFYKIEILLKNYRVEKLVK